MSNSTTHPLTVYKASAGSGKTFTLATQYIRLLVENPQQYRSILAVTFTNKATEEMKMRILSQLYGIWKQLPDSVDYTSNICQQLEYSPEVVSQRAGMALHNLLHHYSYFRVSTIDTFFQSVLRNLARELELTANLRVELNDTQVEEQAVDELIQDLQTTDRLLKWVLRFVMENIEDGRSWNVIGSIKRFGATIFKDYYKEHGEALSEKMNEKDFFDHFTEKLTRQKALAVEHMQQFGLRFRQELQAAGLDVSDIRNGRYVDSFFEKLKNGVFDDSIVTKTVVSYSEHPTNWCKKDSPEEAVSAINSRLFPLLNEALGERKQQYRVFQSAVLTLRHLNQLRLLGEIERKVRTLNTDANRFLLSDTQQLLHQLIDHADSPFIFEKIGAQLEHIMIDEFQDTSTVQWQNFKVLLEECMSHANSQNLIVGDVKQSIYRWRSGDWRLLNNISAHFPQPEKQLSVKSLDTNYRSQRNIISFNNSFFECAMQREYELLKGKVGEDMARQVLKAYADVAQSVPSQREKKGKVAVTLLPADDYRQQVLQHTSLVISQLLAEGAMPKDIAILIRAKDFIPDIISHFARELPTIDIVSDEAFRLDSSLTVRMIVHALHLLLHPDDNIVKAVLVKNYQRNILGQDVGDTELLRSDLPLDSYLPEGFLDHAGELLKMPLPDLCEQIHGLFLLNRLKEENAYLCTFYDYMGNYVADNSSDVDSFLHYWSDTMCRKTIQSDAVNGIRLLTIHKSKGLEFDHVVIPFCDWRLELTQGNMLWCHTEESPYSELPVIPVDYSGKLEGTVFEQAYYDEFLQNRVDNLNLLYVAFTRARNNLFVIGHRRATATRSQLIEDVLPTVRQQLGSATVTGLDDERQPLEFEYGTLCMEARLQRTTRNVFMQPPMPCEIDIQGYSNKTTFRQSNKSRDFIEGEDDDDNGYIKMGRVLHNVLAQIHTMSDVDAALKQLQMDGVLYDTGLTYERISSMLRKRLNSPVVSDWFSDKWEFFNECTILSPSDGQPNGVQERRPDRVMYNGGKMVVVDFKFGKPKAEHHSQVREYMNLLHGMGYSDVKGFLWYVYTNRIDEVSE